MKNLHDIESFGNHEADKDKLLLTSFENHPAYNDVLERSKFIVLGRKGSGKTAIYLKMLSTIKDNFFCEGHTFAEYPWDYHDKQAIKGMPAFDQYTHSWTYFITLVAAKMLFKEQKEIESDESRIDYFATLEKFVYDSYGTTSIESKKLFNPVNRIKFGDEEIVMDNLPLHIRHINETITPNLINSLHSEKEYFICFDELDLGMGRIQNLEEYDSRLIGLIQACKKINIESIKSGKKLFVVIFLRDDIYDVLKFEDKNKITQNSVTYIKWDSPGMDNKLSGLMEKRFTDLMSDKSEDIKTPVSWADVFNEEREMPHRHDKYKFILSRTFNRPRDIILFCNFILGTFKNRASLLESKALKRSDYERAHNDKFDNPDLHLAKRDYSLYLLNELDDEVRRHIPGYTEAIALLRSIGTMLFTRTLFDDKRRQLYPETQETDKILHQLFNFSIIGYYVSGGRTGGSDYIFKYKDTKMPFDPKASRYKVHLGLLDALSLKQK